MKGGKLGKGMLFCGVGIDAMMKELGTEEELLIFEAVTGVTRCLLRVSTSSRLLQPNHAPARRG